MPEALLILALAPLRANLAAWDAYWRELVAVLDEAWVAADG